MTAHTVPMSDDLACDLCGYDLRAQPDDGKCPECGESVAESRRLAASPRRPAWRDSDPRWRRRVLVGVWLLALLPLMDALQVSGWAARVPVPEVWDSRGTVNTLDDTLFCYPGVYQPMVFCVGAVLLFAKERGRRRGPLDWTRRWGVLCSYVALLLSAAQILFACALVLAGIAYIFHALPPNVQPPVTQLFANASTAYIRYGPQPKEVSGIVLVATSSIVVLLACVPLFDALRSSGPKPLAAIVLAPLALFALIHLAQSGRHLVAFGMTPLADFLPYGVYFRPELLVRHVAGLPPGPGVAGPAGALFTGLPRGPGWSGTSGTFLVEAAKWCSVLAVAVWLSVARIAAWRQGRKASAA